MSLFSLQYNFTYWLNFESLSCYKSVRTLSQGVILAVLHKRRHIVKFCFSFIIMVHPHSHPMKTKQNDDLTKLSGEDLRLRLQELNLPIMGTCPRLIERLRTATTPAPARPKGQPSRSQVNKNDVAPGRRPQVRKPQTVEMPEPPAEAQPSDGEQEYISDAGPSVMGCLRSGMKTLRLIVQAMVISYLCNPTRRHSGHRLVHCSDSFKFFSKR